METTAPLPLRQTIPLQKRKILKANLRGIIVVLALWGALTGVFVSLIHAGVLRSPSDSFTLTSVWVRWIAILGLMIVWKLAYPILYFVTYYYDIDANNLTIRKGIFAKQEITLPFSRITDVYVDQDILDVFFGLCDVHISTPTAESGRFAHIDGLDRKGAAKFRELILSRINQSSFVQAQPAKEQPAHYTYGAVTRSV